MKAHMDWFDLTVPDAEQAKDFYCQVVGFSTSPVAVEDHTDYCMNSPEDGKTICGICHSKGINADIPPVWLVYFNVENIEQSIEKTLQLGGQLITPLKMVNGNSKMIVIQDPSGAYCALYESGK